MKRKAIIAFSQILIFSLAVINSAFSSSIFSVVGTVKNADDTLAGTGLEVVVANQTQNLTATTTVGKQQSGKYGVVFLNTENRTVASEGDIVEVTIRNAGEIVSRQSHSLTALDITSARTIIDLTLGVTIEPRPETSVAVVRGLIPNPNPSQLRVMSGGVGYLYYFVGDKDGTPLKGVKAMYTVNRSPFSSPPTGENGVLAIPIDTTGFAPGSVLNVAVTRLDETPLPTPETAQLVVTPRAYEQVWGLGGEASAKVGVAVGGNAYIKGQGEAGIVFVLDELNALTVKRTAELGAGGGIGVKIPGAKLSIGAVSAGVRAKAGVELIGYATFSDAYRFDDRHQREAQMAQAALLLDTAMRSTEGAHPLTLRLVDALIEAKGGNYENRRTLESVALGLQINAGAQGFAGVELGGFSDSSRAGAKPIGLSLVGIVEGTFSSEVERIKYYQLIGGRSQHVENGYALHQELSGELNIGVRLGIGPISPKTTPGYTPELLTQSAGADFGSSDFAAIFAPLGIRNLLEFREEYVVGTDGQPHRFLLSMGDRTTTLTFIVEGRDISRIQQSVINLAAFLEIVNAVGSRNVEVGTDAILTELRALLDQLATLNVACVVTEGPIHEFRFPLKLEANLGLDVGLGFELSASERLNRTTLEGIFIGGRFYPRASYADELQSEAELQSIVDDALKGSWELVKARFTPVNTDFVAGVENAIETVATTVEKGIEVAKGAANLVGKFADDVRVTVVSWFGGTEEEETPFAPAGRMTAYNRAVAHATAPVVGGYHQFTPEGHPLAEPGQLILSYTDAEIARLGISEDILRISYWDPDTARWVSVGGVVDSVNNTVTATITHLHLYAITFDATPPGVGQLTPSPDSVVADSSPRIQASLSDDTDQLDASSIVLLVDSVEVPHIFDGQLVSYTATELSAGVHTVTLKASDRFGNTTEETWSFTVRPPKGPRWDVNGDGVVNLFDLVLVGGAFGTSGQSLPADVTDDGVVNIFDLVRVAAHFGERTSAEAPAIDAVADSRHADLIGGWLTEAKAKDDGSLDFVRGIPVLESLLDAIVPQQTALFANYPNPFNPETWIPYQLSEASDVTLTIYDGLGRVVRRLELGFQPAGTYRSKARAGYWDGRNQVGELVASGAYFYELRAGSFQRIRQMVVLK